MNWRTHAVVGANAAWIAAAFGALDLSVFALSVAGAVAALCPDIDAFGSGAKIHYLFGGVFGLFKNRFRHRGFFHSLYATAVFGILMIPTLLLHPLLPFVLTLGYISHPLIDGFNKSGVEYFFPHKKRYNLVPLSMRSRIGAGWDHAFFLLGVVGVGILWGSVYEHFVANISF